jgi:hypothetical protein
MKSVRSHCLALLLFLSGIFSAQPCHAFPADFDGDGKNDLVVWRESEGNWYVLPSLGVRPKCFSDFGFGGFRQQFGLSGDKPVPGDYDGDGYADAAVWRFSNKTFYIMPSSWCTTPNLPAPAPLVVPLGGVTPALEATDFVDEANVTTDNKSDILFFRNAAQGTNVGTWYVRRSETGVTQTYQMQLGLVSSNDFPTPVSGNYQDISGFAHFAEPASYNRGLVASGCCGAPGVSFAWLNLEAGGAGSSNAIAFSAPSFSVSNSDKPVPGNIGGVSNALWDFTRWRGSGPGTWMYQYNANGTVLPSVSWGLNGDVPIGGDFNGDGLVERAVWRPSEGRWYINIPVACPPFLFDGGPANGARICYRDWGLPSDIPLG